MEIENMKNIVVLKNLPSNMVEEALVILKPNLKIKDINRIKENTNKESNKKGTAVNTKKPKEYVVKEAEMLVSNYITNIEKKEKTYRKEVLEKKYKRLKGFTFLLSLICLIRLVMNFIK